MTIFTKIKAKTALVISIPLMFRASYHCLKRRFDKSSHTMRTVYNTFRRFGFSDKFANGVIEGAYNNAIEKLTETRPREAARWYMSKMSYMINYNVRMD